MTFHISKRPLSVFVVTTIILFSFTINGKKDNEEETLRKDVFQETLFCSYYSKCLDILEDKHRECLMYSKSKQSHHSKGNSKKCELAKKSSEKMLSGYMLRKIEIIKDCVNKNILESKSVIINRRRKDKCYKIIERYFIHDNTVKSAPLTRERTKKSFRQIRRCNKTKKFWFKQCQSLSRCCSVGKKCEIGNGKLKEIKLSKERKNLNDISCNDEN
uniref:Uncharacterized protein n=1 Tax=Strongyloides papillosus TaxID=174720 RepID=A0A0N5BL20_STREA